MARHIADSLNFSAVLDLNFANKLSEFFFPVSKLGCFFITSQGAILYSFLLGNHIITKVWTRSAFDDKNFWMETVLIDIGDAF